MIHQLEDKSDAIKQLSDNALENFPLLNDLVNLQCEVYTTDPKTISNVMILGYSSDEICVSIDGSPGEINELLDILPKEQSLRFFLHKPYLQNIISEHFEFTPKGKTAYLSADKSLLTTDWAYEAKIVSEVDRNLIIQFADELSGVIRSRFLQHIELQLKGESWKTFVALDKGQVVSYVGFCHYFCNIWVEDFIYTPEKWRRKGYAKSALSLATKALLLDGLVPLATIDANNTASINTHLSAGYYEYLNVINGIGNRRI